MLGERALPYASGYNPALVLGPVVLDTANKTPRLKGRFIKPWSTKDVVTEIQISELKASLRRGIPVAVGLRWPKNGKGKNTSVEGLEAMAFVSAADVFDGHSVVLAGYSDEAALWIFANWAGPDWRDRGFGYMTDSYVRPYLNDAFVYE